MNYSFKMHGCYSKIYVWENKTAHKTISDLDSIFCSAIHLPNKEIKYLEQKGMNTYNYTCLCIKINLLMQCWEKWDISKLRREIEQLEKAEVAHFYATQITTEFSVQWSGYFRLPKLNKQAEEGSSWRKEAVLSQTGPRLDGIQPDKGCCQQHNSGTSHSSSPLGHRTWQYLFSCIITAVIWNSSRL